MRLIYCHKLKIEAPGLEYSPFPNELGQRIYQEISQEAWNLWLGHQTMLINEYRLNTLDANSRAFLLEEMKKFLFGEEAAAISDRP